MFNGGNLNDLNNYRPVSKLCCLAKVLGSFFNSQIWDFLEAHSILQPQQSGFRTGRITITAATLIVNNIESCLDNHQHCAALFINLSEALDTVDHNTSLNKLSSVGFDKLLVNWFSYYLSGRTQAVVADSVDPDHL